MAERKREPKAPARDGGARQPKAKPKTKHEHVSRQSRIRASGRGGRGR